MTPYIYVAVRSDIPPADQLVQACHAAQASGAEFGCPDNCHLVAVHVDGPDGLRDFCERAGMAGVRYCLFHEPDDDMGYTASCTEPVSGASRRPFRGLQMYSAA